MSRQPFRLQTSKRRAAATLELIKDACTLARPTGWHDASLSGGPTLLSVGFMGLRSGRGGNVPIGAIATW